MTDLFRTMVSCRALAAMLFIALASASAAAREGGPKPDPVRDLLLKQGYVAVPMATLATGHQLAEMTVNGRKLKMVVDTGAPVTVFDSTAADRLKLIRLEEEGAAFHSGRQSLRRTVVARYALGTLEDGCLWTAGITDLRGPVGAGRPGALDLDGVLGQDVLRKHAAHVDVAGGTLYLLRPDRDAVQALAGTWVGTAVETTEGPLEADRVAAIRYEFTGDRVHMLSKRMDQWMYFRVESKGTKTRLTMYCPSAPDGPNVGKVDTSFDLYRQVADTMTICVPTTEQDKYGDWAKMSTEFKPTPGWGVVHLKREKPAAKPQPAPAAPR